MKMLKSLLMAMLTVLTINLTGCKTPVPIVIPSDMCVTRMPRGVQFTPKDNGWFVPDARMLSILNKIDSTK